MTDRADLLIGLDVGSVAVKAVVRRPDDADPVWHAYVRHESRPAPALLDLVRRIEHETAVRPGHALVFATGAAAAAAEPLGARIVQEVAATVQAVERRCPDARTIVELGGQDAKIVVLETAGSRSRAMVSLNDKCAGGTGVVIDKIAAKLQMGPEALAALAWEGRTVHPIAGKCGVFAETDINGLQKRGVPPEDLMASLFEAIVLQNLTVLARGQLLQPSVVLLGGPHAFLPALVAAWRARIRRVWTSRDLPVAGDPAEVIAAPALAAHFGALGAIDLGEADGEAPPWYAGAEALAAALRGGRRQARDGAPALRATGLPLDEFLQRFQLPAWRAPVHAAGTPVRGFIGLDAGSTSTKAVVLDERGDVLAKAYQLSRGNPIEDAMEMFRALRQTVEADGARLDVQGLVTTGYAKDILKAVFGADAALVETVAHAQSALQLYDDPHVIVDVGGQDIKIIVLRDGRVQDFRLNTQCSAGNGYFLQAIAGTFGYPVERFADLAFEAGEMPTFGYGCVLFLQAEIADVLRRGWRPEEVLAGLAAVLPKNVFLYVAKAPNLARLGRRFVLQGGTQRNLAAVKAQVDFIRENFRGQGCEPDIVLHRHCGEAGAIGAALEAIRLWRDGHATRFIGLDAAGRIAYEARSSDDTRCRFCTNECQRTFIDVRLPAEGPHPAEARQLIVASCEKGAAASLEDLRSVKASIDAVVARTPNLVAVAAREVWRLPAVPVVREPARTAWTPAGRRHAALAARRAEFRVGIPRVFNMYGFAPLFTGYLLALGVPPGNIIFSGFTTTEMYRNGAGRGAIDPCFPSKVALAHVNDLLERHARRPLHALFFPMIDVLPALFRNTVGNAACPTVALTPQTVRAAFREDLFHERRIAYVDPLLNLDDRDAFEWQMLQAWGGLLGVSPAENARAIEAGFAALAGYESRIRAAARTALDALEQEGGVGVLLLGRVYHHDPGLNHGIPGELQKLGYPVFSQSTLPLDDDLLERLFGDDVRSGAVSHPLEVGDVWKNSFSASSNAKLWAAKFAARHPNLAAVELSNFKCGHDATIYSTIQEIVEASGTPYFAFKDIDENRPAGAIALRLETIDYALRRYRARVPRARPAGAPELPAAAAV